MGATDIASVVGTWVAAFVAIIALVGIVGPFLILRASRTERNKAIAAIDDENHQFIGKDREVTFLNSDFSLNAASLSVPNSRTSWIKFEALLKAYQFPLSTGDNLIIEGATAFLPIHRSWIFAFGIVGRYTRRKDSEISRQLHLSTRSGSRFTQAGSQPPFRYDNEGFPMSFDFGGPARLNRSGQYDRALIRELIGTTGILQFEHWIQSSSHIEAGSRRPLFPKDIVLLSSPKTKTDIAAIQQDTLTLKDLAMFAFSCIPCGNNQYMAVDTLLDNRNLDFRRYDSDTASTSGGHSFHSFHSEEDTSSPERTYLVPQPNVIVHRSRSQKRTQNHKRSYSRRMEHARIEAYEFTERPSDSSASDLVRSFQNPEFSILGLEKMRLHEPIRFTLQSYEATTYVPLTSEWIRLDDGSPETRRDVYFRRADMQRLAHCVLKLPWHAESYLIGAHRTEDLPMRLFSLASGNLKPFLARVHNGSTSLELSNIDEGRLVRAIQPVETKVANMTSKTTTRRNLEDTYILERVLLELCHHNAKINNMLSILMITNREFAKLVTESARHLREFPTNATQARVEVNLYNGTVKIPSGFGFMRTFVVDMDVLYPNEERDQQAIMVEYPILLLCCLRASLRSKMLCMALHSDPLLATMEMLGDIVRMN